MIESLTKEQIAEFPYYVDKWLKIGLNTEPTDFEKAKSAACKAYDAAGLPRPKYWYIFDSPLSGCIGKTFLDNIGGQVWDQVRDQVGNQVRDQVWGQVWRQVWDQVGNQVRDQVWNQVGGQVRGQVLDQVGNQVRGQVRGQVLNQVWNQVWDQVWDQVRGQVRDQVWNQVRDQVRDQVWNQVRDQVWNQVRDQVRDQVWDQVRRQVWSQVGDQVWNQVRGLLSSNIDDMIYGSQDHWLSSYDYILNVCNIKDCESLDGLTQLAKCCGWWAPYKNVVIFQHRPTEIHLSDKLLHNDKGMAIRYRDGFGVWAIRGNRVNEQIVMRPETQTIEEINNEQNADIKSIRIERFGWLRYIKESGAICIDERLNDVEGTIEALFQTPDGNKRLVVTCTTGRIFAMGVPSQITSCEEGQRWLSPRKVNVLGRT